MNPLQRQIGALAVAAACITAAPSAASAQRDSTARADSAAQRATPPRAIRHVVRPGDTLWDLAAHYLRDPFRWPEVFHANTDIVRNPHWIYPGQVLTIDAAAVKPEIVARADSSGFVAARVQTRAAPPAPRERTVFVSRPVPQQAERSIAILEPPPALTVRRGEAEAAPFVVDRRRAPRTGRVVGAIESMALGLTSDAGFRLTDRLYFDPPPGTRPQPGDELLLASARTEIPDVGRVVDPVGVLRVDSAPPSGPATGEIVRQFGTVTVGTLVLPMERPFEPTTARPIPGDYPLRAKVLWIRNEPVLASLQSYVILSATSSAGVRPGDQFTLFDDRRHLAGRRTPPVATAVVTVVRVTPFASTAIVVGQTQPMIHEGMPARLTAKMP